LIQLSLRDEPPVQCKSWQEAHKRIANSFDFFGHTAFTLKLDDYEWQEEDIHWKTLDAVASTPEALHGYFQYVGRA
jgi:hypothetical protein